jgi:hypothetical protein
MMSLQGPADGGIPAGRLFASPWEPDGRQSAAYSFRIGGYEVMARPKPEKKSKPAVPAGRGVLPMELQVGDRLADETGEWEVIALPYTTAGGRIVHARVQKINEPASWEIRNWDALKRINVGRASTDEGKR